MSSSRSTTPDQTLSWSSVNRINPSLANPEISAFVRSSCTWMYSGAAPKLCFDLRPWIMRSFSVPPIPIQGYRWNPLLGVDNRLYHCDVERFHLGLQPLEHRLVLERPHNG